MVHRFLPALALPLALAACLSGGPIGPIAGASNHDVLGVRMALPADGAQTVAVTVIDQRPYVLAGKESPKFLGTERGNWSQTVNITTKSGNGLGEDLAAVIAGALTRGGAEAAALPLPRGTAEDAALAAFRTQGAERLLAVRILEWRTDSYTRVTMKWRLEAAVYDRGGATLGRSSIGGNTPVGDTTAGEDANMITQRELSRQLANLLGDPAISRALR
jgi:hypothetical protein